MSTRNGSRHLGQILPRADARQAAEQVARHLVDTLDEYEQAGAATRFSKQTDARYWADVLTALAAYDRMFERYEMVPFERNP
jgi:hypothetical protein